MKKLLTFSAAATFCTMNADSTAAVPSPGCSDVNCTLFDTKADQSDLLLAHLARSKADSLVAKSARADASWEFETDGFSVTVPPAAIPASSAFSAQAAIPNGGCYATLYFRYWIHGSHGIRKPTGQVHGQEASLRQWKEDCCRLAFGRIGHGRHSAATACAR